MLLRWLTLGGSAGLVTFMFWGLIRDWWAGRGRRNGSAVSA
jgi:hypothetical protein